MGRRSVEEIRERTDKPLDAWWAVLVLDHISVRLVWLLDRVAPGLSPHHITAASLVAGVGAGWLLGTGHLVAGAILYQVSLLLDGADGKHARLQGRAGPIGAFWDATAGHVVYLACVIGLMVHLDGLGDSFGIVLGFALLVLRVLTVQANAFSGVGEGTWTPFHAGGDSWMTRNRLLPPGSFPDKQTLLFTLAPIVGLITPALALIVVLEVVLLGMKSRRAVRRLRADVESRVDDR